MAAAFLSKVIRELGCLHSKGRCNPAYFGFQNPLRD